MSVSVEVAGIWEVGWNVPLSESVLWEMVLMEFGVERLNMTPISGITTKGNKPWISEYRSLDEVIADKTHLTPVFLNENAETTLQEFEHPEDVLYCFGRTSQTPVAPDHAVSVRIDNVKPGCLWAHQACAVVLYDRSQKQ